MLAAATFGYIVAGAMLAGLIVLLLIGRYYPGSGADVLDWKPTRSAELEAELEATDMQDMLDAKNERRRRRGLPELTEEDFERQVMQDRAEQLRRRAQYRREQGLEDD